MAEATVKKVRFEIPCPNCAAPLLLIVEDPTQGAPVRYTHQHETLGADPCAVQFEIDLTISATYDLVPG